jgi:tetratricopeptide (TPR) repeat protein
MMGMVLGHVGMFDESCFHFERALAISPHDAFAHLHLGLTRYLSGDFAGGREISRLALEREASQWGLYQLGLTEIQVGNLEGAAAAAVMIGQQFPSSVLAHPLRGLVAALSGDREQALRHVELTIKHRKGFGHYHHAQYDVACIYGQLDRVREGLDWFRDAAQDGFPCYPFFDRDPLLSPLRSDPRYAELTAPLRQLGEEMRALYRTLPIGDRGSGIGDR